ncbi:hypothetical protein FACS1894193_08410 [Bacilli bacterium]|nr:hypothetical protein FACS1894193_08410 [Bacilli bacterium]
MERSEASTSYDNSMKKMDVVQKKVQKEQAQRYNDYIYNRQEGKIGVPVNYKDILVSGENDVMGTIDIPALDIKQLPFFQGTSYKTLDRGLGHFEPSSIPIGGVNTRSVITGHSGLKNQVLFTDINKLKEGDIFFINILGEKLAYEIDSFEEILPSEVDRVKIVPGEDRMTLLTCTPPGINTYRLLVNGKRISYEKAKQRPVAKRNVWSYQRIVLMSLSICFVIFIVLMILHRYFTRKSKSTAPEISARAKRYLRVLIYITRGLFVTFLLAMIGILIAAIYGYFVMKTQTPLPAVEVGAKSELSDYNRDKILKADYSGKQIASVNITNYAEAKRDIQKNVNDWGIGKLVIPSQDVQLPILAGLKNENLLNGATTYREAQRMGKDNYILLSHSVFKTDVLFYRIQYLKTGDQIYISDFTEVYIYKVKRNEVINDTQVEVVAHTKPDETPILTLLRCEGDVGTIYRRVVQAELVETLPLSDEMGQVMQLSKTGEVKGGAYLKDNPLSFFDFVCVNLAANILGNPLQVLLPLILLLVMPILFLSMI